MSRVAKQNSKREELEIVDRGPDWLFVRLHDDSQPSDNLADRLWQLMEKHFVYRLVLEMEPSHRTTGDAPKTCTSTRWGIATLRTHTSVRASSSLLPTRSSATPFSLP